jgi:hypothetical protein
MVILAYLGSQCTKFNRAGWTCWFLKSFYLEPCIWTDVTLPRILTADQKQQCVNICKELHQIASDDATFLSRVITVDESWIYGYDPETKQQASQWKSPNSPRQKKERQPKSKLKSTHTTKGIVHKEFVLAGQQSILHTTVMFYGDCMKMGEDFTLNSADKRLAVASRTHRLTLDGDQ